MNLRTTIVLAILIVIGAGTWLLVSLIKPGEPSSPTLSFLETELKPDQLNRIEVTRGDRRLILERSAGQEWSLPGKWPVRAPEVDRLVTLLTTLRSRFTPLPLSGDSELKKFGLDADPLQIKLKIGDKQHTLTLGEEPADDNRFSRPTYLRLDSNPEVIRLAPGLAAALDRPPEYFQQRRLFAVERVAKEEDGQEKIEQLAAKEIAVQEFDAATKKNDTRYTLARTDGTWELKKPTRDRVDPDRLRSLLTAFPDIWAEKFVDSKGKKLEEFGLDNPEQILTVTRPSGSTITVLVGKISDTKVRMVQKPAPPFGPPMKPKMEIVHETYHYAKLQDNDQIFEIKGDRLKDIVVGADALRDPQLARFKTDEVRKLEIKHGEKHLVLAKDKDKWRVQKPKEMDAETSQVTELLDKLSGMQARDKDVIDKGDPKTYGLEKPTVVKITVEEKPKASGGRKAPDDATPAKTREFTFHLGTSEKEKGKLFVMVEGWPRINSVDDAPLKLVNRPALAYRNRRVLDLSTGDLAKIEIERAGESYALEQVKNTWRLAQPVQADIDTGKADSLAGDLSRLEAVEFVAEDPKAEDLDKVHGLSKPAVTAKITFSDAKKTPQTIRIGKQRDGKDEYFARLDNDPAVFVIRKNVVEAVNKDSLALRPLQLWNVPPDDIAEVRVNKDGPEYRLKREGEKWKVTGPFEATASVDQVEPLTDELGRLRAEKFVAHTAKDLTDYGLEKPYLRLVFTPAVKKDAKEPSKERGLLIGKPSEKDSQTRFAKLEDGPAIFVLGAKVVAALDRSALDLLDRDLLKLDTKNIEKINVSADTGSFSLQHQKEWQVIDSPAPPFPADAEVVASTLRPWSNLKAQKYAAYGAKIDWKAFGLDKPAVAVTVLVKSSAEADTPEKEKSEKEKSEKDKSPKDKGPKTSEHTVALGQEVKGSTGERYARVDKQDAVVILDAATVSELNRSYLDFVNRSVLKFDLDGVNVIQRQMAGADLEIAKKDDAWKIVKPAEQAADTLTVEGLLEKTFRLRAKRVAAYPAKDLKPFGLDTPTAVVTLKLENQTHTIKIGKTVEEGKKETGDRYALVDKGEAVVILDESLAKELVAGPLHFRDRNLASFSDADKIELERGPRKITFSKIDGIWKVTEPVKVDAEDADLEELLKGLLRLRADDLIAEKPAKLTPFGLDRPQAAYRIKYGDKEVLHLQVGNTEAGKEKDKGGRLYAKLGGSDVVFLLSPKVSSRALSEFRSRKAWKAPDAAQVEKVTFAHTANPFTLQKVDNTWQVAGKTDVKINAKAVTDTLDALAGLQAERFIADKEADLQLYGLMPPVLSVEVHTSTGKQVLHVGRPEGESKRHYATVPGSEGVFVISEADSQRIVRDVRAFTEEKKSKEPEKK